MKKQIPRIFWWALASLAAFALWTLAVRTIDIRPIGPLGTEVGFGALNGAFHRLTGVHMELYTLTDWLGLVPLLTVLTFGILGLAQWIRRGDLRKVDGDILILGGFYLVVMALFILFEIAVVNYRPVLIAGALEASYPSSTTLLVLCVMPTARMQLKGRMGKTTLRRILLPAIDVFTALMVAGRLISGVHWVTDIVGGLLLSAGLVGMYAAATNSVN